MTIHIRTTGDDGQDVFNSYPNRHYSEATGILALRFDSELMQLKQHGITLGVKCWKEAVWKMGRFAGEAADKLAELGDIAEPLPDAATEDDVETRVAAMQAYGEWQAEHPTYFLAEKVGVWLAVNLGGGRMTLFDVLLLPDSDIAEEMDDLPDFIDDEPEEPAIEGKA